MYSNDYTQIKNGLVNYIGSLLRACPFDGEKASRQYVAATLIEEAMTLMKEDETYNMYVSKPLLRANKILLESRRNELLKLPSTSSIKETIETYNRNIKFLENIIEKIQG